MFQTPKRRSGELLTNNPSLSDSDLIIEPNFKTITAETTTANNNPDAVLLRFNQTRRMHYNVRHLDGKLCKINFTLHLIANIIQTCSCSKSTQTMKVHYIIHYTELLARNSLTENNFPQTIFSLLVNIRNV
jgi:hypothetical protein